MTSNKNWEVEHDTTKCALCVVCARHCPREALRRDEKDGNLLLFFNPDLCDGCDGNPLCQENCPESAIKSVVAESAPAEEGYRLLFESEMAQCEYCEEYFAPVRRLEVIAGKKRKESERESGMCPICRRASLVVDYIQDVREPGSKAEYRSAKDITRRAAKRMKAEDEARAQDRGRRPPSQLK